MKFGAPSVVVEWGMVDVTAHIQSIGDVNIEDMTVDSKPFGTRYNESLKTGDTNVDDITMGGLYDDDNDGPKQLWDPTVQSAPSPSTSPTNLRITYGTPSGTPGDAITIPMLVKNFKVKFSRNKVHEFEVTFTKGTGSVTRT